MHFLTMFFSQMNIKIVVQLSIFSQIKIKNDPYEVPHHYGKPPGRRLHGGPACLDFLRESYDFEEAKSLEHTVRQAFGA